MESPPIPQAQGYTTAQMQRAAAHKNFLRKGISPAESPAKPNMAGSAAGYPPHKRAPPHMSPAMAPPPAPKSCAAQRTIKLAAIPLAATQKKRTPQRPVITSALINTGESTEDAAFNPKCPKRDREDFMSESSSAQQNPRAQHSPHVKRLLKVAGMTMSEGTTRQKPSSRTAEDFVFLKPKKSLACHANTSAGKDSAKGQMSVWLTEQKPMTAPAQSP